MDGVTKLSQTYTNAEAKFPSWEGWREAPGWFPAPCAGASNVQTPVSDI
ncbi:MAG: hypothetical protein LBM98_09600 [Oscillospiraceae bacterium]|nr:hypothetical protein [Oscillospiraceae bacterium]